VLGETAVAGEIESLVFGSTDGKLDCTSELVTVELVTTVSIHQTNSPWQEILTSKSELLGENFVFGTQVPPDMAVVLAKEITDIRPEVNSGSLILGIILPLLSFVTLSILLLTERDGMIGKSLKDQSSNITIDVERKTIEFAQPITMSNSVNVSETKEASKSREPSLDNNILLPGRNQPSDTAISAVAGFGYLKAEDMDG